MESIRKKTHRSLQEMFTLLETFKESGMSQHLFCKQHNLSYSVFQYWLKKYKKETSVSEEGFVGLKASLSKTLSGGAEYAFDQLHLFLSNPGNYLCFLYK